ncbi:DEAD/DEAH box helicase family protein [Hymenobacter arcticus]
MAGKKKATDPNVAQLDLLDVRDQLKTAPCVPAIRTAVEAWRRSGYPGITDVTQALLSHWFGTDHRLPDGRRFQYHTGQQEAVETMIYLYEVAGIRKRATLLETYARPVKGQEMRLPPYDDFGRYAIKMATGSGKTKVMALAVAWHYLNAVRYPNDPRWAKTFLLLAPNVIVLERLRTDFANNFTFLNDPVLPMDYRWLWDEFRGFMRGDSEAGGSDGGLYLTNIQQLYERPPAASAMPVPLATLLGVGPPPSLGASANGADDFLSRIEARPGPVLVLNDEAHHTHDEESEWNQTIRRLHARRPVALQLDVSATPRFNSGALFPWTISDYPLRQAIIDRLVKRPIKGLSRIQEVNSDIASVRYEGFLVAGVERWREYRAQLKPLGKKPVLFVMMNSTKEADDVAHWLQTKYPADFAGEGTLTIHTDRSGDVSTKDLEEARCAAREIDDNQSPVNAVVSVLMLREGWDVQNVTVVVGLRPYTSKANILPEQAIGRGLRLMFRSLTQSGFTERVDIIGNKKFLEFIDDLEKSEGLKFDTFEVGKDKLRIVTIEPVPAKVAADIGLPDLSPLLVRKKSLRDEIEALDVTNFPLSSLRVKNKPGQANQKFTYEATDIVTKEKLFEREYELSPPATAEEVIGYYAKRITENIKLPSQFPALVPKIRQYMTERLFRETVDLTDPNVIRALTTDQVRYVVTKTFEQVLLPMVVEAKEPELLHLARLLSGTAHFPTSRQLFESARTIFNYVVCDNNFEEAFAKFLDKAPDVAAFAKLPENFGFSVAYTDTRTNLRHYYPDFVVRQPDGTHWLVETKGREDVDVAHKDEAARAWCSRATELTQVQWKYLKVMQTEFERMQPDDFEDLLNGSSDWFN